MKIIIEVKKEVYRQAVCNGWNEAYDEELDVSDFKRLDDKGDFVRAVSELREDDFDLKVED